MQIHGMNKQETYFKQLEGQQLFIKDAMTCKQLRDWKCSLTGKVNKENDSSISNGKEAMMVTRDSEEA